MRRWALLALLSLAPVAEAAEERPDLLCGGVEPSWSLELTAETGLFSAPDTPEIDYSVQHSARAEGRRWPEVLTLLAPTDTALVLLRPAACADTMSDRAYDWMVDVLTQQQ